MRNSENGRQDKLDWFDGKHINEILFCQEFLKTHPMRCIGGTLFTVDGPVESEELVKRQIIDMIQSCVTTNLSKRQHRKHLDWCCLQSGDSRYPQGCTVYLQSVRKEGLLYGHTWKQKVPCLVYGRKALQVLLFSCLHQ